MVHCSAELAFLKIKPDSFPIDMLLVMFWRVFSLSRRVGGIESASWLVLEIRDAMKRDGYWEDAKCRSHCFNGQDCRPVQDSSGPRYPDSSMGLSLKGPESAPIPKIPQFNKILFKPITAYFKPVLCKALRCFTVKIIHHPQPEEAFLPRKKYFKNF